MKKNIVIENRKLKKENKSYQFVVRRLKKKQ